MPTPVSKSTMSLPVPVGQIALHTTVCSHLPLPAVRSYIIAGARRTLQEGAFTEEYYPPRYGTDGSLVGNL